jgi:hypothetical protein
MENQTFKLVEGEFSPVEAADVLFSLIGDKIKFHNLQMLSNQERFGGDNSHSEKRIDQLKAAKEQVKEMILEARDKGYTLNINSNVEVTLVKEIHKAY